MRYFTIGPVQMSARIIQAGGHQARYFRDSAFAGEVISAQNKLLSVLDAEAGSKIAIMSGSGTAGMEASVTNFSERGDTVLVVNGGSFGQRFVDIAEFFQRRVINHRVPHGRNIDLDNLRTQIAEDQPTVLLLNVHETSTGQLYDVAAIGKMCREFGVLLVCDVVSAVASDPLSMADMGIDVALFSSNKGLGLAPGAAFLIAGPLALSRLNCTESYYLALEPYFDGSERGQPPVTSSIGVLQQLFERLNEIDEFGGFEAVVQKTKRNAESFRGGISDLGIEVFPQTPSNALTAFILPRGSSNELYAFLKNEHGLIINKSAWGLEADVPRIAHVGDLSIEDHTTLVGAIKEYLQCT